MKYTKVKQMTSKQHSPEQTNQKIINVNKTHVMNIKNKSG